MTQVIFIKDKWRKKRRCRQYNTERTGSLTRGDTGCNVDDDTGCGLQVEIVADAVLNAGSGIQKVTQAEIQTLMTPVKNVIALVPASS